ncbi:hypothetical protein MASR1M65_20600 [Saprospiraceae bacterium]
MACTNGKINLKPYYYPLDELLKEGKVYEYKSDNLNMASSFWYYKTILRNDTTYLVGQNISQLMEVEQKTVERKTGNGMVLHSNQIFLKDSTGKTNMYQVEVLEKSLFRLQLRIRMVYFYIKLNGIPILFDILLLSETGALSDLRK